jgi:AGZA family xanthine/uracil permease-like MFS transporter
MVAVLSQGERTTPDGRVVGGIDFRNLEDALPVVLTMLVMPLTFSITNGIGAGFISYVLVKVASGKGREVHPAIYVVALLFLLYFLRWTLFGAQF